MLSRLSPSLRYLRSEISPPRLFASARSRLGYSRYSYELLPIDRDTFEFKQAIQRTFADPWFAHLNRKDAVAVLRDAVVRWGEERGLPHQQRLRCGAERTLLDTVLGRSYAVEFDASHTYVRFSRLRSRIKQATELSGYDGAPACKGQSQTSSGWCVRCKQTQA
jgi:hypothetical protein